MEALDEAIFPWLAGRDEGRVNLLLLQPGLHCSGDELAITVPDPDPDHSDEEDRYITIGWSNRGRLLMISHTDRGDKIRIISARELTPRERKAYEEENS
jgi:hypothetical protein